MRLADFIVHDIDGIVAEWEAFARTLLPASRGLSALALRDHAPQILAAVARDMATVQTREQQSDKSRGLAPVLAGVPETAAQSHAVLRAQDGFDIQQLVAEYRALRASVLRRWMDAVGADGPQVDEIMRFNEAIDQAIAESVAHFQGKVERARNLMLATLGHDMRSPLGTIFMSAALLSGLRAGEPVDQAAARLKSSAASLRALVDDLSTFSRTSLGLGLNLAVCEMDMAAAVRDEVEQLRGANPARRIDLAVSGDTRGVWDGARLQQLVRNLVTNALRYGADAGPVGVDLAGDGGADGDVRLQVSNRDAGLDLGVSDELFGPLRRGPSPAAGGDDRQSMGLGLFIVREVARAHGGEVSVRAGDGTTTFTVRLPRRAPGADGG